MSLTSTIILRDESAALSKSTLPFVEAEKAWIASRNPKPHILTQTTTQAEAEAYGRTAHGTAPAADPNGARTLDR